jgi:hypothetical protein
MPPKGKKKRAVAKFSVEAGPVESVEESISVAAEPPMRQVVEVVEEEESTVPEALEAIKESAREIEETVESIEEEHTAVAAPSIVRDPEPMPAPAFVEEREETTKSVDSLFAKSPSGIPPEITVVGKRDKSLGVWVGAMLGIALAVGVSLVLLVRGPATFTSMIVKPTPTLAPTPIPTEAPVAALDRKDVQIRVVNGGGVVGAGSKMKAFLEAKGYTVVSVGNAEEYTYTDTVINIKAGKEAYVKLISDDLKADYSLDSQSGSVDADAAYDAEVVVGKE